MAPVANIAARMELTPHGKRLHALSMYQKGKAFIGASHLLADKAKAEPFQYVALHLLCQGLEITLKGILLLHDFDGQQGRLKKPLGHNLLRVAEDAVALYGMNPLRPPLKAELKQLSGLYSQHLLRYASTHDILVAPSTVATTLVRRRLHVLLRVTERELARAQGAI